MVRKWLHRWGPLFPPPPGHRHRFKKAGSYKGLPLLSCSCGMQLVPAGRPQDTKPWPHHNMTTGRFCRERWVPLGGTCSVCGRVRLA